MSVALKTPVLQERVPPGALLSARRRGGVVAGAVRLVEASGVEATGARDGGQRARQIVLGTWGSKRCRRGAAVTTPPRDASQLPPSGVVPHLMLVQASQDMILEPLEANAQ